MKIGKITFSEDVRGMTFENFLAIYKAALVSEMLDAKVVYKKVGGGKDLQKKKKSKGD